jgi:hypothetical protein
MIGLFFMETIGPHSTWFLGIVQQIAGLSILLLLPKTSTQPEQVLDHDLDTPLAKSSEMNLMNISEQFEGLSAHFKDSVLPLLRPTIIIGLLAMLVNCLVQPIMQLLLQYMSVRFRWPISQVSRNTRLSGDVR